MHRTDTKLALRQRDTAKATAIKLGGGVNITLVPIAFSTGDESEFVVDCDADDQ